MPRIRQFGGRDRFRFNGAPLVAVRYFTSTGDAYADADADRAAIDRTNALALFPPGLLRVEETNRSADFPTYGAFAMVDVNDHPATIGAPMIGGFR